MEYLAKSAGETIIQHTENLLKNYDLLKKYYPEIPVNWSLLRLICKYHDLGKMNELFQQKIREGTMKKEGEIPHALLSIALLPVKELKKVYGVADVKAMTYAIALHHERDFSQLTKDQYDNEIAKLQVPAKHFPFSELGLPFPNEIERPDARFYRFLHRPSSKNDYFKLYVMLKGLLNRIDYAASGDYPVEYPANFLSHNMSRVLNGWKQKSPTGTADWNEMQKYVEQHQNDNLIVIGQTGLGKTEAGLLWLGDNKGFFTLPLRAAINAIYTRIRDGIADKANYQQQVGILHSDSLAVLLAEDSENEVVELDQLANYLNETRSWSLPLTVTTLDQTFDFVYHYAGFEKKLATFAYSKVVIDEIQMYSPDLLAYLLKGLKEIQDFGGKFLVMTATLPTYLLDLFQSQGLKWEMSEQPFLDEDLLERHYLQLIKDNLSAEMVAKLYQNGKLLVICNTVRKAKEVYQELSALLPKVEIQLIHSQFIRKDRQQKEQDIMEFAQSNQAGIWIATQVVEASLDIDFDLLITELSELNGLFQRMGRCYRKRSLVNRNKPNVYVFDGGDNFTSGISKSEYSIVHDEIFSLSKKALRSREDGILNEHEKMSLIAATYTTEALKETSYYHQIKTMLAWLSVTENDDKSEKEVKRLFRNIQSRAIIPRKIYDDFTAEINECVRVLTLTSKEISQQFKENPSIIRRIYRSKLDDYKISIAEWLFIKCAQQNQVQFKEIGKYEGFYIVDGEYAKDYGFETLHGVEEDRFF